MKDNTVKLSGLAKDRFIERFFAEEAGLDAATRSRLVLRSQNVLTSLRVRKAVLGRQRIVHKPEKPNALPSKAAAAASSVVQAAPAASTQTGSAAAFDPYVFGLVPVFQREGAEGLLSRLGGIGAVDQLRLMAKSQQIVLPQELRTGDATAEAVRQGIVEAVGKRIKDRRAAAG